MYVCMVVCIYVCMYVCPVQPPSNRHAGTSHYLSIIESRLSSVQSVGFVIVTSILEVIHVLYKGFHCILDLGPALNLDSGRQSLHWGPVPFVGGQSLLLGANPGFHWMCMSIVNSLALLSLDRENY